MNIMVFAGDMPADDDVMVSLAERNGYQVEIEVSKEANTLLIGIDYENDINFLEAKKLQTSGHNISIVEWPELFTTSDILDEQDRFDDAIENNTQSQFDDEKSQWDEEQWQQTKWALYITLPIFILAAIWILGKS